MIANRTIGPQLAQEDTFVHESTQPLRILHVTTSVTETSMPYNEHCLSFMDKRDIAICSFFPAEVSIPNQIVAFEGNGSPTGFSQALKAAHAGCEYDLVHIHTPHTGLLFLMARATQRGLTSASVFTVHNCYQNFKSRNRLMLLPIFAGFRRIVCCSYASFASFPLLYKRAASNRLTYVPNGVDVQRIERVLQCKSRHPEDDNFTVISVGRLIKIKNPLTLLEAFVQSSDASSRLLFIGRGELKTALEAKSNSANFAKQVKLTGLIPRDEVYGRLATSSLFVSASWGEGLPVAALEAMVCRCPVILSDIPPHREIVGDTDFIPLIRPDDVAGFAREIERFRHMSPTDRARIGEQCRQLVEEHFSLDTMHRGYSNVYAELND